MPGLLCQLTDQAKACPVCDITISFFVTDVRFKGIYKIHIYKYNFLALPSQLFEKQGKIQAMPGPLHYKPNQVKPCWAYYPVVGTTSRKGASSFEASSW